jgi:hypothetical protein
MAWAIDASGSQTAVIGTEHVLDTPTTVGTYRFKVDLSNLALSEVVELRVYEQIDGSNYRQVQKAAFEGGSIIDPGAAMLPWETTGNQLKFTLKQLSGTGRAFPWLVARI